MFRWMSGGLVRIVRSALLLPLGVSAGFALEPSAPADGTAVDRPTVFIVVGAPGEEEYGQQFARCTGTLEQAAQKAGAKTLVIGVRTNETAPPREQLQLALESETKDGTAELWIILIGH